MPDYFCPSAWIEHAPFAVWICDTLRPRCLVELRTHYGYSYFAFCQAIDRLGLGTAAYAIDTRQGDKHARALRGAPIFAGKPISLHALRAAAGDRRVLQWVESGLPRAVRKSRIPLADLHPENRRAAFLSPQQ